METSVQHYTITRPTGLRITSKCTLHQCERTALLLSPSIKIKIAAAVPCVLHICVHLSQTLWSSAGYVRCLHGLECVHFLADFLSLFSMMSSPPSLSSPQLGRWFAGWFADFASGCCFWGSWFREECLTFAWTWGQEFVRFSGVFIAITGKGGGGV